MKGDQALPLDEVEYIPGGMPADLAKAYQKRLDWYTALGLVVATTSCIPAERIHVYADSDGPCRCGAK